MSIVTIRRKNIPFASPLANKICDAACVLFALWTISAHVIVALGGNLFQLLATFGILLFGVGIFLGTHYLSKPGSLCSTEDPFDASEACSAAIDPEGTHRTFQLRIAGAIVGIACISFFAYTKNHFVFWWCAILLLAASSVVILASPRPVEPKSSTRVIDEGILWAIAFGCVLLTAFCHRHDVDDAFYVNVAVSIADFPSRALLSGDTLLGVKGLPLHMPAHRVQSYELACGAMSYLTGIPALHCFHWLSASFAALLAPLAYARLFRILTPRTWLPAVISTIVMLIAVGEAHRSFGNFAFVRIWQGKAIFLTVFLPLVYAYGLRFAARPSLGRWILLAASQIAAVGCTSTALWVAPLSAALSLFSWVCFSKKGLRTLVLGVLSSAYVLLVALLIKGGINQVVMSNPFVKVGPLREGLPFLETMFSEVLGTGVFAVFALASLVLCWTVVRRGLAQRFAILLPLGALLTVANPYLSDFLRINVTGPVQWRSMWAIPIPILLGLLLSSPLRFEFTGWRRRAAQVLFVFCLSFSAFVLPEYSTLSPENRSGVPVIRLDAPGLKVDEEPYLWAGKLNKSVPQGSYVIAPFHVCFWIPTYHKHAYPLEVSDIYLWGQLSSLGEKEIKTRHILTAYVSGQILHPNAAALFRRGLAKYNIKAVCLLKFSGAAEARNILSASGFKLTDEDLYFEIWVRA